MAHDEKDIPRVAIRLPPAEYASLKREAALRGVTTQALLLIMFRAAAAEFFTDF